MNRANEWVIEKPRQQRKKNSEQKCIWRNMKKWIRASFQFCAVRRFCTNNRMKCQDARTQNSALHKRAQCNKTRAQMKLWRISRVAFLLSANQIAFVACRSCAFFSSLALCAAAARFSVWHVCGRTSASAISIECLQCVVIVRALEICDAIIDSTFKYVCSTRST